MINLIFDLDNTLYFRETAFLNAIQDVFPAVANQDISTLFEHFEHFSAVYFEHHERKLIDFVTMRRLRIQATLRSYDIDISSEDAAKWQQSYERNQYALSLSDDVVAILDWCKNERIPIGIITNGNTAHQTQKIKNLNLEQWFQSHLIVISESFGVAKPNRAIFDYMHSKLPDNPTYYIGDDYEKDIVGAHKAGWRSIWFSQKQHSQSPLPDFQVSNHRDLFELLKTLK
ncbi:HAD family hydrolase [Erysipelothrix aquatica]|uniref:HAD family hydrolase n=1 Tax=Erysipelothrix aquatica TaxID=2683714 RepID=UPI00135753A7|nr:HAD family hydrolase [Erysipelothrix aquatica]